MEVSILTKRNIQPNLSMPFSEHNGHRVERNVNKKEYNNGPTKDISFRGSAVLKASKFARKAAETAADEIKIPDYARKLAKNEKFNKVIDKVLQNEAVVEAAIVLGLTTTIKPACTLIMPGASKDDKEVLATKHALSGLIGYGFSKLIFTPISKAANKVAKDPESYVKGNEQFVKKLQQGGKFNECFGVMWKKAPDVLMSIPKSLLTVALITPTLAFLFPNHKKAQNKKPTKKQIQTSNVISQKISNDRTLTFKGKQENNNNNISFTGLKPSDAAEMAQKTGLMAGIKKGYDNFIEVLAKGIAKASTTKPMEVMTEGLTKSKKPAPLMSNLASIVLTLSLLNNTAKSKKIEKERKPYLLLNTALVTIVSSTASTIIDFCSDWILDSMEKGYMAEKFGLNDKQMKKALKQLSDIKEFGKVQDAANEVLTADNIRQLNKYMLGVNKLKSHTIFSFVVRFASPLLVVPLTTKILDMVEKFTKKKNEKAAQAQPQAQNAQPQPQAQANNTQKA